MSVEELLQEAVRLSEGQRLALAHRLLLASEPAASAEVEQAWDLEIREHPCLPGHEKISRLAIRRDVWDG